ncbi:MAG: ATP-binding protein, partial [Ardenticatenaceae bacterium]
PATMEGAPGMEDAWETLAAFSLPSEPGNERLAMQRVTEAVQSPDAPWILPPARLDRLKTAVAEATMNAIEHGNANRAELPVEIEVRRSPAAIAVRITDQGGGKPIGEPGTPDLEAKLAGLQSPRGWGLFLIEKMVDEMTIMSDAAHHTIELVLYREGKGGDHAK